MTWKEKIKLMWEGKQGYMLQIGWPWKVLFVELASKLVTKEELMQVFLLFTGNAEGGARDSYVTDGDQWALFRGRGKSVVLLALQRSEQVNECTLKEADFIWSYGARAMRGLRKARALPGEKEAEITWSSGKNVYNGFFIPPKNAFNV